jgi:4-hydroxy-tetrahydrodipicolinate reductase
MNLLILGRGKTGSMVAEVAFSRRHHVRVLSSAENENAAALTADALAKTDMVLDFTTPAAAVANAEACIRANKNIVIGTTGWYGQVPRLARNGALGQDRLSLRIEFFHRREPFFRDCRHRWSRPEIRLLGPDFRAPSRAEERRSFGTALTLQKIVREAGGQSAESRSLPSARATPSACTKLVFNSSGDRIYLCHDAKSRLGFAEGAVRAAEWLAGKTGFFEFRNIWREL